MLQPDLRRQELLAADEADENLRSANANRRPAGRLSFSAVSAPLRETFKDRSFSALHGVPSRLAGHKQEISRRATEIAEESRETLQDSNTFPNCLSALLINVGLLKIPGFHVNQFRRVHCLTQSGGNLLGSQRRNLIIEILIELHGAAPPLVTGQ